MKHVIYRTEYYKRNEIFCFKEEESDAYFNTIDDDDADKTEVQPPIGCRLLLPILLKGKLSQEQLDILTDKKPGYNLRYASIYDVGENQYAIYTVYERIFKGEEYKGEGYWAHVSFGEHDDVVIDMYVIPTDYSLTSKHVTLWNAVNSIKAENGISIFASDNPDQDKVVIICNGDWTISGKWYRMEQISQYEFVYYCRNSLFHFKVTFNIESSAGDGNYDDLLK